MIFKFYRIWFKETLKGLAWRDYMKHKDSPEQWSEWLRELEKKQSGCGV